MSDDNVTAYISSACNLTANSVDWALKQNKIAYGSCNGTALYFLENHKDSSISGHIQSILHTNNTRVNCVRWIRETGDVGKEDLPECSEGISGSANGNVSVWSICQNKHPIILKGHTLAVNAADGLAVHCLKTLCNTLIATASADSTIKIWARRHCSDDADAATSNFDCIQTLDFGNGICLALRLWVLPGNENKASTVLLACAMDDSKIQLYGGMKSVFHNQEISSGEQFESNENSMETKFVKVDTLSGHEDWVRALEFTKDKDSDDILLASGSQDAMIRLWRISPRSSIRSHQPIKDIEAEERCFQIDTNQFYAVTLESVLSGHEGWIYGLSWKPQAIGSESMSLLSASIDKTMIIWSPDEETGVWVETVRVGDVGGNGLGFYGCKFSPDGNSIMGHNYQGAFYMWTLNESSNSWQPQPTIGGHFKDVIDVLWEPEGQFLISVGADQTTRLHAPCGKGSSRDDWHEIARPQVHGFDMTCLAILSRFRFASGAEEKVIRSFAAPQNFLQNLKRLSGAKVTKEDLIISGSTPQGASVPSLGLSNKAVYEQSKETLEPGRHVKNEFAEAYFTPLELQKPPTEDNLIQNTLWPEIHKLYGHGYEIYALGASHDGKLLASACKATTIEHAAIILWDAETWQEKQKLIFHSLTVTKLSFSPDDNHLLSVSRDRTWALWKRDNVTKVYAKVAFTDKKTQIHGRIIWCCAWSHDSNYFATGSRDGKVIVWGQTENQTKTSLRNYTHVCVKMPIKEDSVTAVDFSPCFLSENTQAIAVGLNSGAIIVYKWNSLDPEKWIEFMKMDTNMAHHLCVTRVTFRPILGCAHRNDDSKSASSSLVLQLASCGMDHAVKIFNLDFAPVTNS